MKRYSHLHISKAGRHIVWILLLLFNLLRVEAQINAEQCLTIGRNVLSMEDYMLSIQYFNQAIKAKPYLSDPYFFRGLAKLYLEDYKGAEDDCSAAIERNQYKTESYKVRGFARQYLGKDSLAVEDYNIGLKHNPQDKYFLYYKGVAETELKRYDAADSTLRYLLRLYPRFEDGYSAMGRLKVLRGDTVGALVELSRAIEMAPTAVNPYLQRAEIEAARKEWDKASEDMDKAINLKPQEADLYVNRAYVRYNSDDFFGAMSDYNYALELQPYSTAALFNRALLRYEVRDLDRSAADLEEVLKIEPENFHALYNHGLVNLERGKNREALSDFNKITAKYPRFYAAYYAMAEAWHNLGNMREAMQNVRTAENLVKKYVKNPEKFKLDRPSIVSGETNTAGLNPEDESADEESDIEVMKRFNRLVTVSANSDVQLSYNEKIRGRVQDREMQPDPCPPYVLTLFENPGILKSTSNFFRELDLFNSGGYVKDIIYLSPETSLPEGEAAVSELFAKAEYYNRLMTEGHARPADLILLGIIQSMLKNYPSSTAAYDKALDSDPRSVIAIVGRAIAMQGEPDVYSVRNIMADYDAALALNPRLPYIWFNKGNLYYNMHDYTSAMQCYSEALRLDSDFGPAYYNRGISYLQAGNKRQAFIDLSKAGEQGIVQAYSLLKRMK